MLKAASQGRLSRALARWRTTSGPIVLLVVAGLLFAAGIPPPDGIPLRRRFAVRTLRESRGFFTAFPRTAPRVPGHCDRDLS